MFALVPILVVLVFILLSFPYSFSSCTLPPTYSLSCMLLLLLLLLVLLIQMDDSQRAVTKPKLLQVPILNFD